MLPQTPLGMWTSSLGQEQAEEGEVKGASLGGEGGVPRAGGSTAGSKGEGRVHAAAEKHKARGTPCPRCRKQPMFYTSTVHVFSISTHFLLAPS